MKRQTLESLNCLGTVYQIPRAASMGTQRFFPGSRTLRGTVQRTELIRFVRAFREGQGFPSPQSSYSYAVREISHGKRFFRRKAQTREQTFIEYGRRLAAPGVC